MRLRVGSYATITEGPPAARWRTGIVISYTGDDRAVIIMPDAVTFACPVGSFEPPSVAGKRNALAKFRGSGALAVFKVAVEFCDDGMLCTMRDRLRLGDDPTAVRMVQVRQLRDRQKKLAEPEGRLFMGLPDRWMDDPHYVCPQGHIMAAVIKSEQLGDVCQACGGPLVLTSPEDTGEGLPC